MKKNPGDDFLRTLPLGRGVTLITCDANGLVAFDKPAGVLSHPNSPSDGPRSLLAAHYEPDGEYYECGTRNADCGMASEEREPRPAPPRRLWLLNRLDSATSGVILAATTEKLAVEIRALFRGRGIGKTYAALVFGRPPEKSGEWRDRLAVQKRGGQIRSGRDGNIPAEARMTLMGARRDSPAAPGVSLSLLRLEPRTGRSHQLRVQCASRRLPIVGDATYGDFRANREFARRTGEKRLFLHSLETRFDYTHEGRACHFSASAELPAEFTKHL